jgi:very-long-chain (3R)-3-hydroxyacyl-CoA dehydratase
MAASLRKAYLLSYNLLQCSLWTHTFYLLLKHVPPYMQLPPTVRWSPAAVTALYTQISPSALIAQRLSWLEVGHATVGLAGGGIGAAFIQALGRSAVLLVLVEAAASARGCVAAPLLIVAAACSDLVRYTFYVAGLVGACPRWLMVLRYSMFLVAYPAGIACEWLLYFVSLAEVDAKGIGRVTMPNSWNFAFDYGVWNRGVLAVYAYFGPSLFLYMLRQRNKKVS